MKLNKWKALGLTAFMAIALVACNAEKESEKKESEAPAAEQVEKEEKHDGEEHEHEVTARFIVSSDKAVHVLDDQFQQIEQFDIGAAGFAKVDNGRYVFARDADNKDSYTLIDSGLYVEDHGDHLHPYEEKPAVAKEVEANAPAHMISHAGRTAIFNDESGKVDVYDNKALATDSFTAEFVYEGAAHHGAAVPLSTGELAVTVVAKEGDPLPTGVKIVDKEGKETATVSNSCEGLHGTAYGGEGENEKLAFGCMGKAVVYDVATKKAIDVALSDKEARVGTVKLGKDSDYFFTNYAIENQPQTKVGVIDAKTGDFKLVELPAAYKSATLVAPNNKAYVAAEDGKIYKIDLQKAEIELTIAAYNPFNLEEDAPLLFMANDELYTAMPSYQKVYAIHGDHVHEVAKLDFVPTAIEAIGIH